jgi:hypothetical protein
MYAATQAMSITVALGDRGGALHLMDTVRLAPAELASPRSRLTDTPASLLMMTSGSICWRTQPGAISHTVWRVSATASHRRHSTWVRAMSRPKRARVASGTLASAPCGSQDASDDGSS